MYMSSTRTYNYAYTHLSYLFFESGYDNKVALFKPKQNVSITKPIKNII